MQAFTEEELSAYLDELLPVERATALEQLLRDSPAWQRRLAESIAVRDQGGNTLGEIWRRRRLSCPSRDEISSYLLGAVTPRKHDYLRFHLEELGCRFCQANRDDLLATGAYTANATPAESTDRRLRFFESSAGWIPSA